MKIIREGKEFELTAEELVAAYLEQEAIWDRENVVTTMFLFLNSSEYMALSENEAFITCVASELRKNERSGMSFNDALLLAFKEGKAAFFAEGQSSLDAQISAAAGRTAEVSANSNPARNSPERA